MNEELIQKSLELAGYNMLVTSEISMKDKDVYNAYHNLWRIEESFRIMKSQLDARPVYLQKQDTIVGHFFNLLSGRITDKITAVQDIKKMVIVPKSCLNSYVTSELPKISDRKYINLSHGTSFIRGIVRAVQLTTDIVFFERRRHQKKC